MSTTLGILVLLAGGPVWAADEVGEERIEQLLAKTDDVARGESSHAIMEMQVKTQRYERTMKMESWAKGTEQTLIRILEPAKDAGVATLKVEDNLWNYLPKVDRTMKVPAGMMSGAWMGSHFSNDDLVRENRLSEDFTWTVDQRPTGDEGKWVITLTPKPDAAIVWGKVRAHIRPDELPIEVEYFDEKGELVRTMSFEDYQTMDGKKVPARMRLTPHDKPGEFTEMRYVELDFQPDISDSMFSLQSLRK